MTVTIDRRRLLAAGGALGLTLAARAGVAAYLVPTPAQSRGPFYPVQLPLDQDNDLATVAGRSERARGRIVNVIGRVLDERGQPLTGAEIEIWQCDANGRYHHPGDRRGPPPDPNFQGYGRAAADAEGRYRFRTIQPVPYPGRAPHIHFIVRASGGRSLTTQMYVAGAPENERDFLLRSVTDPAARRQLLVEFAPAASYEEPVGSFDIVLPARG